MTMRMRAVLTAVAVIVALGRGGDGAHAQFVVTAEQDLQFGLLIPGMPSTVETTDVARRAAYRIEARGRFDLSFQLPTSLVSPQGAQIPLVFSPTSGRVIVRNRTNTVFDPQVGVSMHLNPADREGDVFLGGTAQPAAGQPAGTYTATIVMIVVQTGT